MTEQDEGLQAKDTVMRTYKFSLDGVIREVPIKEITINLPEFLRKQAEITGKIMYKAGMKAQHAKDNKKIEELFKEIEGTISRIQMGHPEPEAAAGHPFEPTYLMIDTREWQSLKDRYLGGVK